ncbi:hypothetical protein D3C80_1731400 [compost metagenome]
MIFAAILADTGNVGANWPLIKLGECLRELPVRHVVALHVQTGYLRQQIGGVDQRAFGRTPHAGFHFLYENAQHEIARHRHNQEIPQQQAQADSHDWRLTLYPMPRWV